MYKISLSPYARIFYTEWKLNPTRSDYNIVFDQTLEGKIEKERLNNAIKRFISHYVILNSHIQESEEELYWIKNKVIHNLEYFKKKLTNKQILSCIQNPFNLKSGPLYRFMLIKDNNIHRLIVVFHHIVLDGLSFDYFCNELSNYYNNKQYNNYPSIEEQILSISSLSKSLSEYIKLRKEESKEFWKTKLSSIEPINLSFLKSRNKQNNSLIKIDQKLKLSIQQLSKINELRFSFSKKTLNKLNYLAITPYMYGQLIYAFLLYKYTGQEKFCINFPVSINKGKDFIYGAQINTSIMVYDFNKVSNPIDILNQCKEFLSSIKTNINHSYLPIYDIISVSHKDILNLQFIQTSLKDEVFKFNGIQATINRETSIDLTNILLFEHEIRNLKINYRVRYNSNNIDIKLLKEFIKCYKKLFIEVLSELLKSNTIKGLSSLKNYQILSNQQYQQIIYDWNATDKEYPRDKTIHALFEEQVARTPDNIALVYEDI
ncbi:MAG: hypothetical protein J0M23_06950, partial [Rickettsiales bacterium]|nr:hypothetical protein [Rickettsiales bacterium]